jgi:hypothetical protein
MNKFREEKIFIKMKLKVNLFSSAMLEINELSTKKYYTKIELVLYNRFITTSVAKCFECM